MYKLQSRISRISLNTVATAYKVSMLQDAHFFILTLLDSSRGDGTWRTIILKSLVLVIFLFQGASGKCYQASFITSHSAPEIYLRISLPPCFCVSLVLLMSPPLLAQTLSFLAYVVYVISVPKATLLL